MKPLMKNLNYTLTLRRLILKIMQDRNLIGGFMAVTLSPILEQFYSLRYFFLLLPILLAVDLLFGIKAAVVRKERVKRSRAVKRTLNKFVDYVCWLLLAGALGLVFGEPFHIPILPIVVMAIVVSIELESCVVNYFEYKGKKVKFNWRKLFGKKGEEMLGGIIEEVPLDQKGKDDETGTTAQEVFSERKLHDRKVVGWWALFMRYT